MKIFKRILVSMLVFILMLSSIQISASVLVTMGEYSTIINEDNTITLEKYIGNEKKVIIPNEIDGYKVKNVFRACFQDKAHAENIEKIFIPSGVLLGEDFSDICIMFEKCTNLKEFEVDANNQNYSSQDGILFNKEGTSLLSFPQASELEKYTISQTVSFIISMAFDKNQNLKSIDFGGDSISFGATMIRHMQSLERIVFPENMDGVQIVDCPKLANAYIGKNVPKGIFDIRDCPNVTLHVYKGSTAEQYAIEKNIPYVYRCIEDEATGIKVEGQFDKNTKLTIEKPGLDEFIEGVNAAYTLSLNAEFDSVDISIPCADATNFVYRYENNEYTKVNSVYEDGCYKFTVSKLGTYVIKTGDNVPKYSLGDVDGDGIVAVKDVTYIQLHLANLGSLTDEGKIAADYDKDGNLTVKDATYIQLYLANLL